MADTLRSAEEMADDVLHSPVPRAPEIIHADRLAVLKHGLDRLAERYSKHDHAAGQWAATVLSAIAHGPTALEALLEEKK
jgi:hypothetical protein